MLTLIYLKFYKFEKVKNNFDIHSIIIEDKLETFNIKTILGEEKCL